MNNDEAESDMKESVTQTVIQGNSCKPCANTRRSVGHSFGRALRNPNMENLSLTAKKLAVGVRRMIRGDHTQE
jgi:hypothetical protein